MTKEIIISETFKEEGTERRKIVLFHEKSGVKIEGVAKNNMNYDLTKLDILLKIEKILSKMYGKKIEVEIQK